MDKGLKKVLNKTLEEVEKIFKIDKNQQIKIENIIKKYSKNAKYLSLLEENIFKMFNEIDKTLSIDSNKNLHNLILINLKYKPEFPIVTNPFLPPFINYIFIFYDMFVLRKKRYKLVTISGIFYLRMLILSFSYKELSDYLLNKKESLYDLKISYIKEKLSNLQLKEELERLVEKTDKLIHKC